MTKEVKVSVVVPIYNSEKYIERCIKSLLSQEFDSYEIVLVDDGSTDTSSELCESYKKNCDRVKVLHKKNGGMSDARNYGVKYSSGQYITFVDSDDSVVPEYISTLFDLILKYNADMSLGGFNIIENDKILNSKNKEDCDYCLDGKETFRKLLYGGDVSSSACSLMIKRECALKNEFPVGRYHEDDLTSYKYYLDSNKVAITNRRIYNYYQNEGSVMHTFNQQILDLLYATENYFKVAKEMGSSFYLAASCRKFIVYLYIIKYYPDIKSKYCFEYKEIVEYLNKMKWKIITSYKYPFELKKKAIKYIFKLY